MSVKLTKEGIMEIRRYNLARVSQDLVINEDGTAHIEYTTNEHGEDVRTFVTATVTEIIQVPEPIEV